MEDVIRLMARGKPTIDDDGNEKPAVTYNRVLCDIRSVTRSEFYQAAQRGLHPSAIFVISNPMDYNGEMELEWTDPKGKKVIYDVIRAYHDPETGEVELTAEERIGSNG